MRKLEKQWVVLALAITVIAGGAGWQLWSKKSGAPEYKTAKIEKGDITAAVSASGTLSPVVSVQVGSQVSGQLREVLVDFNSEVTQGQLIARIDPQTFEYKVRQAQADLEAARAQELMQQSSLAAQRAQAAQVAVNAANARRDLERKQQLMDKGFISGAERDTVQATYGALAEQVNAANAQVKVAEASVRSAAAAVKQREAALAQAKIDLERTAIRAPVNGIVIKRSVEAGQTVAASLQAPELFIIAENLTDMRVDTAIDESEIGRIRDGQRATFTVDAFPGRSFEGSVKQIRKSAQNVSNVVTYMVEVSAPNPTRELLPGMTANVRIVTERRENVLKVPNAALRFRPPGAQAATSESEIPSRQSIQTGEERQGGLNAGLRERLEKELQLSSEQKNELDAIFSGMRDKRAAARDAAPEERRKIMERNRAEQREQIEEILTPEQKKKFAAIFEAEVETGRAEGSRRSGISAPGRIYVLDGNREPKELQIRTGLSDGRMTEVMGEDLKEGMEILVGVALPQANSSSGAAGQRAPGPRMF
jgi:HlyD family secretion protein